MQSRRLLDAGRMITALIEVLLLCAVAHHAGMIISTFLTLSDVVGLSAMSNTPYAGIELNPRKSAWFGCSHNACFEALGGLPTPGIGLIIQRETTMEATKADDYRMRSEALRKKSTKRQSSEARVRLVRKAKALNDLADNEDWLDGKPVSTLK